MKFRRDLDHEQILTELDARRDHVQIVKLFIDDFLWDIQRALELSFYRTFSSPSVSALLHRTGQFERFGQKCYDDTTLIILEIIRNGYDVGRGREALERMNQIHGRFDIANEDYLFVLSTFVLDPIDWIEKFGWRPLSLTEKNALFYALREVGKLMHIKKLPATLAAMRKQSEQYVANHCRYADSNRMVADAAMHIGESWLPLPLRNHARSVVCSLLDDATLSALGYERPKQAFVNLVHSTLKARAAARRLVGPVLDGRWPDGLRSYPQGYKIEELGP